MKIGWMIGKQDWAYKNLAKHTIKKMTGYSHQENDKNGDVIVAMYPAVLKDVCRRKTILHLDSIRVLQYRKIVREDEMAKRILQKQFGVVWSWTEISKYLHRALSSYEWTVEPSNSVMRYGFYDIILAQQALMLKNIKEKHKTITRIGSVSIFDGRYNTEEIKQNMAGCFAVIATNKYLYDIAKNVNQNTFLIPNGLDLDEWSVVPEKNGTFTAGFSGNIGTNAYREYKGYDFVEDACKQLDIPLYSALYGQKQIQHDQMRSKFYSQISCLVHPTRGEGCSNSIMEALACGVPVITTREAGFHGETLIDGENVLFCERSTDSIVKCITRLKIDKELYKKLKRNGRKFAELYHDINQIAKQYDALFKACYQTNMKKRTMEVESMRLRYTGNKPKKIVIYGNKQYVFTPECDVFDEATVKFLLAPDKKGLFEVVSTAPKVVIDTPAHIQKLIGKEPKEEKNKLRCQYCDFIAQSGLGLSSHIRHKHNQVKK